MKFYALAAALLLANATAFAAEDEWPLAGAGLQTCAKFSVDRQHGPAAEYGYLAWAQGFISGHNTRGVNDKTSFYDLKSMTTDQQAEFIRKYCAENKKAKYIDAVLSLMDQLDAAPVPKDAQPIAEGFH